MSQRHRHREPAKPREGPEPDPRAGASPEFSHAPKRAQGAPGREPQAVAGGIGDGTMRLNRRLIQVPDWMVDYVVARRLVWLRHGGRGRTSREALERVMPAWRHRGEALQREPPGLFW